MVNNNKFHMQEAKISLQFVTNANKQRACTIVRACLDNYVITMQRKYERQKNIIAFFEAALETPKTCTGSTNISRMSGSSIA